MSKSSFLFFFQKYISFYDFLEIVKKVGKKLVFPFLKISYSEKKNAFTVRTKLFGSDMIHQALLQIRQTMFYKEA